MMKIRLTLSALFVASLLVTPAMAKEWKTVRFGVEGAYPPFSWTDASARSRGLILISPTPFVSRWRSSASWWRRIGTA